MSSIPRQQLEQWLKSLEIKADRVIDIGGSQLPVDKRVGKWDVKEYFIQDLEMPHVCKTGPDLIFDISKETEDELFNNFYGDKEGGFHKISGIFDAAFCLEVMEYVSDPVQTIKNINQLLKKGGKLYISFSFDYPNHNPIGLDYFRYTRFGAKQLLENNGFKIDEIIPRTCEMNTGYPELMGFYSKQGMKWTRDCCEIYKGNIHQETGHFIVAEKI